MLQHLQQRQKKLMEQVNNFYTKRGTQVYFKDEMPNPEIDVEEVISTVENKIPDHLLSQLDMIVVGHFEEFEDRKINAFYKDSILHISNIQDNHKDMIDDIIHEVAHSIESPYGYEIYGDQSIKDEFLQKRKRLHDKLRALGYKAPLKWFMETEYDVEFDNFLLNKVGYDKLNMICMGLFINAYAATSLREYFATGFTDFYMHSDHNFLKKVSPRLYEKLFLLKDAKKLDNLS